MQRVGNYCLCFVAGVCIGGAAACVRQAQGPDEQDDSRGDDTRGNDSRDDSARDDTGDTIGNDTFVGHDDATPADGGSDPEPLRAGPFEVLFDDAHGEKSGNADWVIDDNEPNPSPASPSSAESWKGAYSSFGYDLWDTGRFHVKTLPSGSTITFNDSGNTLDLSHFDLFVVPEPNNPFTLAEKNALIDFVDNGGGLFIIADHGGSDRDNDGWDAVEVWNDFFTVNDRTLNPFGFSFDGNNFTQDPITNLAPLPAHRVLHGPFGDVTAIGIHGGSAMTTDHAVNADVRGLVWRNGYPQSDRYVDFLVSKYGSGRVAAIGDSAPGDDGTGQSGDDLYNGWTAAGVTNNILFLNTAAWLVRDRGY
jgi:hypothetical protein